MKQNVRLIARLDIKGPNLIKGIRLEGLRVVGDPYEYAKSYYENGADELLYIDIVASLYNRNSLSDIVRYTARDIFIPLTVGGGIRTIDDVKSLLRSGADKVAINTAAVARPELINEVSRRFGSQCMVLSIEAKRTSSGTWEAYTDNGRERTGLDVVEWAQRGVELGAGEILLTSVDQEGTRKGFDLELIKAVSDAVSIPVIASGGMGEPAHLVESVQQGHADAVAMADVLHYKRHSLSEIRQAAEACGYSSEENMTPRVIIIDYGMGNLFSVWRAFEHCGAEVVLTSEPDKIIAADYLVLPGVGAFADGMAELRERGLIEPIREYAATGKPFLGICLGMQMMMEQSTEFGTFEGLGLIEGSVVLFDAVDENGGRLKLPHIGWSELQPAGESPAWDRTIMKNIVPGTPTYFVHSYTAQPVHPEHILAVARYGVHEVTAAVVRGNLYGTQFHPERSGPAGLEIIKGFLDCGIPVTMENGQQL